MTNNLFKFSRVQDAWGSRNEPESMRVLVAFFWRTLLVVMLIVLAVVCWFGFQELSTVSQAENPGTTPSVTTPPWSPEELQSTLGFFSQQQNAYQALSQSPLPTIADPSK